MLLRVRGLDLDTALGRPLIRGLTMTLGHERVALIGRNGAGKSTLLRALSGGGVRGGAVRALGEARRVPQDPSEDDPAGIFVRLRARAEADPEFARQWRREAGKAGLRGIEERLRSAGSDAGSGPGAESGSELGSARRAPSLSRGEMRKVHLLAALLERPELLLVDEPTEDLDARGVAWLLDWLPRWSGGLVVVSHDRRLLRHFQHFFVLR